VRVSRAAPRGSGRSPTRHNPARATSIKVAFDMTPSAQPLRATVAGDGALASVSAPANVELAG